MKKARITAIVVVLIFTVVVVFAQTGSFGGKRTTQVQVQIRSNVRGASVYLGKLHGRTPFTFTIAPGYYTIRVSASGYSTFNGRINVSKNSYQTINITLQPLMVSVMFSSNVRGARLYLNNRPKGVTPANLRLTPGSYTVRLEAKGYATYQGRVNITTSSRQNYNFQMEPAVVSVRFSSNVKGAKLYLDNKYRGATPLNLRLTPDTYNVRVEAKGYTAYQGQVTVTPLSGQNYSFRLQPSTATLNVVVPAKYLNKLVKNQKNLIRLWVDKKPMNSKGGVRNFHVTPGRHTIRITTGGVDVTRQFTFEPGAVYNLELFMDIRLRK